MSLVEKSIEFNILDPAKMQLKTDEEGEIILKIGNQEFRDISVNPAFPLSEVGSYVAFSDSDGEEIGILRDYRELDSDSQKIMEHTLEKIYFMPKIVQIHSIEEEYGVSRWDVETVKGHRVFDIRSRRRDVRPFGQRRIIIHDVDGNRYEIPDYTKLDKKSQKVLSSEI